MKISTDFLRRHEACAEQVELFDAVFGPGDHDTTPENLVKAAESGLEIGWLAQFIPPPIRAEYERQCAVVGAEYGRQHEALAEYGRHLAVILSNALQGVIEP